MLSNDAALIFVEIFHTLLRAVKAALVIDFLGSPKPVVARDIQTVALVIGKNCEGGIFSWI